MVKTPLSEKTGFVGDTVRAGVIGFGLAGRVFHAAVLSATPGYELAGIVQRKGNEAAEAYPGSPIYRSIEEMLADGSIRLVVVATPTPSHFAIARQCLLAGRSVLVDKPMTLTSGEAAELIQISRERGVQLGAYQNRRWDGDYQTVQQVLASGELGRLVLFESHFDRYRQDARPGAWREEDLAGGGILFDLGPHLIDQALHLFGPPQSLWADIRIERGTVPTDDAFDLHLAYPRLTVVLRATMTARAPGPRFTLHGTAGSFVKWGLDPQEDAIVRGESVGAAHWGEEPQASWGTLTAANGESRRIQTLPGDYRGIYANVRKAMLGLAPLAVSGADAWRTARIIELARESSAKGRRVAVDFSDVP